MGMKHLILFCLTVSICDAVALTNRKAKPWRESCEQAIKFFKNKDVCGEQSGSADKLEFKKCNGAGKVTAVFEKVDDAGTLLNGQMHCRITEERNNGKKITRFYESGASTVQHFDEKNNLQLTVNTPDGSQVFCRKNTDKPMHWCGLVDGPRPSVNGAGYAEVKVPSVKQLQELTLGSVKTTDIFPYTAPAKAALLQDTPPAQTGGN